MAAVAPACSKKEPEAQAPAACCQQPKIPAGVTPFKVLSENSEGPSDGRKVALKVAFTAPPKRDGIYPALHTLYRYAMTRTAFEPIHFAAEVFVDEASARAGKPIALIRREQGWLAPKCENDLPYGFSEQVERAFAASLGRAEDEDIDDTCHLAEKKAKPRPDDNFKHKPGYKLDEAGRSIEVTYPYLADGADEYVKELRFNSVMTYWIEFTNALMQKVPDLKQVTYVGLHNDAEVARISVTREQYNAGISALQEEIASHAAVTFQTLGMRKTDDKGAAKEQETFKSKTYKAALARLPKNQVTVSPKLK